MKILKKILLFIVGLLVVLIILMFALGKQYHFETSIVINAPIEKVYEQVSSSKKFNEWNPWMKLDPNLKLTYSGNQGEVGDEYCWDGNDDVGQGCHIITALEPNEKVATKMLFKKPFESDATSDVVLTKEGNATKVTWSMDCEFDYPMNLMKLLMDSQMEKSYGEGLSKLKELSEQ
ncbi:SRPBCC family protein [Empedobacter brevis]